MITIIDYKSGNIGSVKNALERLNEKYIVTSDPEKIKEAEKIIFPGVGRASTSMKKLKDLITPIKNTKVPFLGICLGMQLLFPSSEEDNTDCLGIIKGEVKIFPRNDLKIPQIGWNNVKIIKDDPLFSNIPNNSYFYFVNSYYVKVANKDNLLGETEYGINFASAIKHNNFYGVQFHPEKSGKIGEKLLENFIRI